ncbi:MAG: hypothetical protein LC667_12670 [Thioalkalivibrio sp.]|nr:hypothetical protein [Thioalkalivibrio sp.]
MGTHDATLEEAWAALATNAHRRRLFAGFRKGCVELQRAGCTRIYLDGSFVTGKPLPGDFDACWLVDGVDLSNLDPALMDFTDGRKKQKQRYLGEFFPATLLADGTRTFLDFFQVEKHTGLQKGIVAIRLTSRNGATR